MNHNQIYREAITDSKPQQFEIDKENEVVKALVRRQQWAAEIESKKFIAQLQEKFHEVEMNAMDGAIVKDENFVRANLIEARTLKKVVNLMTTGKYE